MKINKLSIIFMMAMICQITFGQVTVDDNVPVFGRFVGFNNNSGIALPIQNKGFDEIDISSNGRIKFAITELPVWNGLNGLTRDSVQRTTMGLFGQDDPARSMLHLLGDQYIPSPISRAWMNVGTTYETNLDIMYTGLLERPSPSSDTTQTDAVIAWGCQYETANPDNFRILFISPTSFQAGQIGNEPEGNEVLRITPWGNVGMGNSFSNALQPARRLVVHEATDSAQFRIAWGVNADPVLGQHGDFQVTENGVLHIMNRDSSTRRPTVIGFLENEDDDPTAFTWLDVGGITRIRDLREDSSRLCNRQFNSDKTMTKALG
ncbi:hypothetical protein O3Q51_11005 [Cryomorphaceae bacterium 1068]|nr:hypothetical protein [Cryomorphaceae bacterium 1068]